MDLPDLCLAPHEVGDLASSESLCAPAEMRVRVGLWRSASVYHARWIGLSDGKFDLVARRDAPDAPLLRFSFKRVDTAPPNFKLAKAIARCDCLRCLFFGADQKLIGHRGRWAAQLILSSDGQSCWQAPDGEIAPFRFSHLKPNQLLPRTLRTRESDAHIEAEVRAMLRDENSDCAFGWTWLHWSARQRNRVWARAQRGSLEECEKILRAITRSDRMWQTEPSRDLVLELGALEGRFGENNSIQAYLFAGRDNQEFSAAQNRLLSLVFAHFGISLNQPVERYGAARHYSHRHGYTWRISLDLPSQHERLEALFDVRDWLRDKIPTDELTSLMKEL